MVSISSVRNGRQIKMLHAKVGKLHENLLINNQRNLCYMRWLNSDTAADSTQNLNFDCAGRRILSVSNCWSLCTHNHSSSHLFMKRNAHTAHTTLVQKISSLPIACDTEVVANTKATTCLMNKIVNKHTYAYKSNSLPKVNIKYPSKLLFDITPDKYKQYLFLMRIHQPAGTWTLFFPASWSIALATASGTLPSADLMFRFFLGSYFIRAASCIINDLIDADIDKQVKRTKDRPIAAGLISKKQGTVCLSIPLTLALGVLLTFDQYSVMWGAFSMVPLTIYPMMKRYTYFPQVFLGMTLNWGILVGWSAVHEGVMDWSVICPLYTACIMWTVIYDTIYAHQDRADDVKAGAKSLALLWGDNTQNWLHGCAVVMACSLATAGYCADQTLPYAVGTIFTACRLSYMISATRLHIPTDCDKAFRATKWIGAVMLACIIYGTYLKKTAVPTQETELELLETHLPETQPRALPAEPLPKESCADSDTSGKR